MAGPKCDCRRGRIGSPAASRGSRMPEAVALPGSISLVVLTVNGARVALPERAGGQPAAGRGARADAGRPVRRTHLPQAHRRDSRPADYAAHIECCRAPARGSRGSAAARGFVPMQLAGPLPARLQPDGRLRVQVRPGTWTLEVTARSASALESVRRPDSGVAEEVWSFEPVDRLRASAVEGPSSIDPSQANVPSDWAHLPAYRLSPGDEITVAERSRGPGDEDRNQIAVERTSGGTLPARATPSRILVSGRMQQDWRLAMADPTDCRVRARTDNRCSSRRARTTVPGVEVRQPDLGVEATGRIEQRGALPTSGWTTRLASLGMTLPSSAGASAARDDSASTAHRPPWLDRWRLLDIFAVLLVAAVAFRVAGVPAAVLSLVAFTLTHHELARRLPGRRSICWSRSPSCAPCPKAGCASGLVTGARSASRSWSYCSCPLRFRRRGLRSFRSSSPRRGRERLSRSWLRAHARMRRRLQRPSRRR
jgi:hypothetical protein